MVCRPCNLSCQGCTTFSDLKWAGYVTWDEGRSGIEPWLSRLKFQGWGAMGGEPLMNPDLKNWLEGIRKIMPYTQIRFVTNGLLLHRYRWVVDLLHELGNSVLKISYHMQDAQLDAEIDRVRQRFAWQSVSEFGINRWVTNNDFTFQISHPQKFLKTFRGPYNDMMPHNTAPAEAFDLCVQKRCPMIHNGFLYKCGTTALTPDILDRFDRPNYAAWQPYINSGLHPNCSDQDLQKFLCNFGRPNALCRQCPGTQQPMIDHIKTVTRK